ncbi:MAG TPA: hypothetical protein HA362_08275 [Nanoarchaeota archaeon]|nr:hypothetical protein [Nanoarchaeota archaeon]
MKHKKGIAPIIAFVMLMALAVTMGAFVTIWYTRSTQSQTSEMIERLATGEECADVKFDVSFDYENCAAIIYNLGSFKIDKIKAERYSGAVMRSEIWGTGEDSELCYEVSGRLPGLIPKNGCAIPMNATLTKLQFSPIIVKGSTMMQCLNNREFTPAGAFSGC